MSFKDTGVVFCPTDKVGGSQTVSEESDNTHATRWSSADEGSDHDPDDSEEQEEDDGMEVESRVECYSEDDSAGSEYSYAYYQSDDEEDAEPSAKPAAAAMVTSITGVKCKANDDLLELDRILDNLKDAFAQAGVGYMNGSFKMQKEIDDLFLPHINRISNFIAEKYDGSEILVIPTLKIHTCFNGLLSLLGNNSSLGEWGKKKKLHDAILDMLDVFAKSEHYSAIFLHNCIDGDDNTNCKAFLKQINTEAVSAGNITPMCQKIVSTYGKVNKAIKSGIEAGLILYDGPLDDHAPDDWAGDAKIQPEVQSPVATSESGSNNVSASDIDLNSARTHSPPTAEWTQFIEHVPRCAAAEGIRESSLIYKQSSSLPTFDQAVPKCLKRLFKELDGLKDILPAEPNCSIWLRFDEDTPQYIRALIAAPLPGPTPYSGGMFAFDIYVPNDYPQRNPKVQLLTTGGNTVRFGPNLYQSGHVCLSLLGTWSGPRWDPKHSSLHQLLISIQGMILGVEHPYYLEPGHGGWEGKVKEGSFQVSEQNIDGQVVQHEEGVPLRAILYEDKLRVGSVKFAMNQLIEWSLGSSKRSGNALDPFGSIIQAHFHENRTRILAEVVNWMSDQALGRSRSEATGKDTKGKDTFVIDELNGLLPKLEGLLNKVTIPQTIDSISVTTPKAASTDATVDAEENLKQPAKPPSATDESKPGASSSSLPASELEMLGQEQQKMQAAENDDKILTDKLNKEAKRLEDLQQGMQEAAQQKDYIRAGHLQAQIMALTENTTATNVKQQVPSAWQNETNDGWNDGDDGWGDDEWDTGFGHAPHLAAPAVASAHASKIPIIAKSSLKKLPPKYTPPHTKLTSSTQRLMSSLFEPPSGPSVAQQTALSDQLKLSEHSAFSAGAYHQSDSLVPEEDSNPSVVAGPFVPIADFSPTISSAATGGAWTHESGPHEKCTCSKDQCSCCAVM